MASVTAAHAPWSHTGSGHAETRVQCQESRHHTSEDLLLLDNIKIMTKCLLFLDIMAAKNSASDPHVPC